MFQDWKSKFKENPHIPLHLLWDVDRSKIDYQRMKRLIVQRVIERGDREDFYTILQLYGGPKGVRKIVKNHCNFYDPRDEALARVLFNLKKEDLKCYERRRLRELHLNS